ncbi:hypothetical protein EV126DRAFT_420706 [Verticillium dahliae]|nr:hypothetical protein EV126DRAFT_420706 [Verticillium dahliae]
MTSSRVSRLASCESPWWSLALVLDPRDKNAQKPMRRLTREHDDDDNRCDGSGFVPVQPFSRPFRGRIRPLAPVSGRVHVAQIMAKSEQERRQPALADTVPSCLLPGPLRRALRDKGKIRKKDGARNPDLGYESAPRPGIRFPCPIRFDHDVTNKERDARAKQKNEPLPLSNGASVRVTWELAQAAFRLSPPFVCLFKMRFRQQARKRRPIHHQLSDEGPGINKWIVEPMSPPKRIDCRP